ncbi:MAG: DUF2851 family protein [Bacteroidales bacterium]|nr:DUF2851 family protein [Bacteroidales bacterium]
MSEDFLQFLWKNQLFLTDNLVGTNEEDIIVLDPGESNSDAGPDFFNAKVEIDGILWAGNVEMHLKSSDWNRHKHNIDPAYDSVILHVVLKDDKPAKRMDDRLITTLVIKPDAKYYDKYNEILKSNLWIPCERDIYKVDPFRIKHWLGKVLVERLHDKTDDFKTLLENNKNSWEESFYQGMAKSFGFKVNSLQFERLARSLPLKYLIQNKESVFKIEALLFGQAGLLDGEIFGDDYYVSLRNEYGFLKKKYHLKSIEGHLWKFMRMRPMNFPSIRIAQFAALIYSTESLFSRIIEAETIEEVLSIFNFEVSSYWNNHFQFNKSSVLKSKNMGLDSQYSILINTVIPFLFIYGAMKDEVEIKNRAIDFLDKIPPEKNNIISQWKRLGVKSTSAFYSQALIQLKNNYCKNKKCLNCEIGNQIIIFNKS